MSDDDELKFNIIEKFNKRLRKNKTNLYNSENKKNCRMKLIFDQGDLELEGVNDFRQVVNKWSEDYNVVVYNTKAGFYPLPKTVAEEALEQSTLDIEELDVHEGPDMMRTFEAVLQSREVDLMAIRVLAQRLDYDLSDVVISLK